MFKPELLSPAGSLKHMRYAFAYGADAIYAGQPRYSLRVRNNEFNCENLNTGINEAHKLGKKFYIVANIIPHNNKLKTFISDLKPIIKMKPDALIMSDPGLIMLVRENFPEIPIHLSVQANTVNWATVKFWKKIGLSRIILSRELSLEEIEEIRFRVPDIEIEIFVHGALCVAYSGRCLLSSYINKRDPNQGACTNSCRWKYNIQVGQEDDIGNIICKNTSVNSKTTNQAFIVERITKHPSGEYMTSFEDEHGSYIFNSKDLCAISCINSLFKLKVNSLKIEGRTKSFYYCARTTQVYRRAIEDAVQNKPFNPDLLEMLKGLANRGYTEGFLRRHNNDSFQNYERSFSISKKQQFVGVFINQYKGNYTAVEVKNKFSIEDNLELMSPKRQINFVLRYMKNSKGEEILVAPGSGHIVWILIPEKIDIQYALLIRNL